MSVSNGQKADSTTFNSAFPSRVSNTSLSGVVSLLNPTSGGNVANIQQALNDNASDITAAQGDIIALDSRVTNLEAQASAKNNFTAIVDPLPTNDSSIGEDYEVGSRWINTALNKSFECLDASVGAAIWKRVDKVMIEIKSFAVLDMSLNNVDDTNYTEIVADVGNFDVKRIQCFYPDGDAAFIATGAAASEVDEYILTAGGNAETGLDVNIPANSRISIKLVSGGTTNTTGKLIMNFLGES